MFEMFLKVRSKERAIAFYVGEAGLFEEAADFGAGYVSLKCTCADHVYLSIIESDSVSPTENPLFSIGVKNCNREIARLSSVEFKSGGSAYLDSSGRIAVLEYPLGKNFMLIDPDGHRFLLMEWNDKAFTTDR